MLAMESVGVLHRQKPMTKGPSMESIGVLAQQKPLTEGPAMERVGTCIQVPSLRSEHRRIMLKLIQAGFHIIIMIYGIQAHFDATCLILALQNCLDKPVLLLELKGKTFHRFKSSDLSTSGVPLRPALFDNLDCELPAPLSLMADEDVPEFEADYAFVDNIYIKQNGLIEITGMVVKNQPDVRIKWWVADGVKKFKSDSEKGLSLFADTGTPLIREGSPKQCEVCLGVSQGSHGNLAVKSDRSALVTFSLLKMMRFIGENAQISYSGGISAIVGVVPSLLQPAGAKPASVDYL